METEQVKAGGKLLREGLTGTEEPVLKAMGITALVIAGQLTPMQLFAPGALDPILERIRAEARTAAAELDISTEDGRKAIASLAYKVSRTKTYIDERRVELVAERKREVAAIDSEGRRFRDAMDALKEEVRAPLTEWEEAEKKRVHDLSGHVQVMLEISAIPFKSLEQIARFAITLDEIWNRNFQEYTKPATQAHEKARLHLQSEEKRILEAEAKRVEEERLRAEAEEKARIERETKIAEDARLKAEAEATRREEAQRRAAKQREEEAARIAAEEKARLEREKKASEERFQKSLDDARAEARRLLQAEQREREAEQERRKIADKQAEYDRVVAKEKAELEREAAVADERKRQECIREAEAAKQREAEILEQLRIGDKTHRKEVYNRAVAAMIEIEPITTYLARTVIDAIDKGRIPGVSINY